MPLLRRCRQAIVFEPDGMARFLLSASMAGSHFNLRALWERVRASLSASTKQGCWARSIAIFSPPICSWLCRPARPARRPGRREKLIIRPIRAGGDGETVWSKAIVGARRAQGTAGGIRAARRRLQRDGGAARQREREMVAANDRLTVLASIDMCPALPTAAGSRAAWSSNG